MPSKGLWNHRSLHSQRCNTKPPTTRLADETGYWLPKSIGQLSPAEKPPSTKIVCPVIHAEASDARKIAAPTMSAGTPMRLRGVFEIPHSCILGCDQSFLVKSVST